MVDAFIEIEKLQTDPFTYKSVKISEVSEPKVSSLTTSVDSSNISNCSTLSPDYSLSDPPCPNVSEIVFNSSILSPLIDSVSDHTELTISQLNTELSNLSSNNSLLDVHGRSIVYGLESSCLTLSPAVTLQSETFSSFELSTFSASSPIIIDSFPDVTYNEHESPVIYDKSAVDSEVYSVRGNRISLKEFSIQLPQLDVHNLHNAMYVNDILSNSESTKHIQNTKKCLFTKVWRDCVFKRFSKVYFSCRESSACFQSWGNS